MRVGPFGRSGGSHGPPTVGRRSLAIAMTAACRASRASEPPARVPRCSPISEAGRPRATRCAVARSTMRHAFADTSSGHFPSCTRRARGGAVSRAASCSHHYQARFLVENTYVVRTSDIWSGYRTHNIVSRHRDPNRRWIRVQSRRRRDAALDGIEELRDHYDEAQSRWLGDERKRGGGGRIARDGCVAARR
jgi:hypothetical protein